MLHAVLGRAARAIALSLFVFGTAGLAACSSTSEADRPRADRELGTSVQAQSGRTAARAMLGLAEARSTDARLADYEVVTTHLLDFIEREEPGTFHRFGTEVTSRDGERFIRAWSAMRERVQSASKNAVLTAEIKADPHFAGRTTPSKSALGGGTSTRDWGYEPPDDGIPNIGRGADGWFGDGKTGPWAAAEDLGGLLADRTVLDRVDRGEIVPDPDSRLGAYACTHGYDPGTVGHAVHNAIGFIYLTLGTYMEEKIGRVFCSPEAKAFYNDPIDSDSSVRMGEIEHRYWDNVRKEDDWSAAGKLGAAFSPSVRDWLQANVFRNRLGEEPKNRVDCSDKPDGWWCLADAGWMAYCEGRAIAGGCGCAACSEGGVRASCSASAPPAACP